MAGRVVLIEDEANIAEAIRFLLSREGWQVDVHEDGSTALSVIEAAAPDLVILDLMLPGKSGMEIIRDIREIEALAHLPVLMLTARGQLKDREMAEKAGVTRFMTKPFSNTEVLAAVRDLNAQARQARDPEAGSAPVTSVRDVG
ncbi:response regulator transcription factor [Epibacterium sp. Ofav1-8]|uniref:response regulator transcription factor n=1 Tax=Epibacterium sp. Ofav1-8 TaxID=2917735 RepID=UPI001EF699AE|nr:response regulator [Epibacterium sp. Ofav1-8]MCG7622397.1 response regulator [Epibacterium sp. Ofav1-8]